MQQSFWLISLVAHGPVHSLLLLFHLLDPRKNKANRHAIAKGWPPPLVAMMQFYAQLTSCGQLLTIAYAALSLHGGYPTAREVVRVLKSRVRARVCDSRSFLPHS
jgi:hypothetical protein